MKNYLYQTQLTLVPLDNVEEEFCLWCEHPSTKTHSNGKKVSIKNKNDIGIPCLKITYFLLDNKTSLSTKQMSLPNPSWCWKHICVSSTIHTHNLESNEQMILQSIKYVISYDPIPESQLQSAPRWIIYKSIANEKEN